MAEAAARDLYEEDFYAWTQDQAARLRAFADDNRFDAERVAEEIEDLGRAARNATQSNIERCLEHLLKLASRPATAPKGAWRREARTFAKNARRNFSPGMRQHLDMAEAWDEAVLAAEDELADYGEGPIGDIGGCPFTFDELIHPHFDLDTAVATLKPRLRAPPGSG